MGQWTDAGFEAKTLAYYKAAIQQVFIDAYGDDFLLDDALPQGILIQELAEMFYNADMDGIEVLSRLNLNSAPGLYLDLIGGLRGIVRNPGSKASLTVTLTSSASSIPYSIPAGQRFVCNETAEAFETDEVVNIVSTTQTCVLSALDSGSVQTAVADTMSVENSNITDVTVTAVAQGAGRESDMDYRGRLLRTYTTAGNTNQSVLNLLLALDCVDTAGVNYNDSAETVGGLAPYSTEFMAVKKVDFDQALFETQVAQTILNNKTPGAPTDGNTTVSVTDTFGTTKQVKFTIPTEKKIEIEVSVATPETTGVLDLSGVPAIKDAIMAYINNLDIGKDVSFSRCMAPLTADSGFDVTSFSIRAVGDANWTQNANYIIDSREYATCEASNIKVGGV